MSYLKGLLGEAFKEDMTLEDVSAALESAGVGAAVDQSKDIEHLRSLLSKKNSEAADYKRQLRAKQTDAEAEKQASLEELTRLQEENQELTRRITVSEQKARLMALGYEESMATETAEAMFDGNMETVIANQSKMLEARERAIRAEVMAQTPTPPGGGSGEAMTKEKFLKMGTEEQNTYIQDNPNWMSELS
nr:MAG TPA: Major head protein [Caudoviricetes sp.]